LLAHENADDIGALFLSDQVEMVAALDALADVSPERASQLRSLADVILNAARTRFRDASAGGFHARDSRQGASGVFRHRLRPLADNARMARLLLMRGRLHDEPLFREEALSTLRSLAEPRALAEEGRNVADYLLALEHARSPQVMLSVVGPLADPRTRALLDRTKSLFLPQAFVVHFEPGEGRYPYPGEPGVYLCSDNACSSPIFEAEALQSGITAFLADPS
jgi:uncharacterized protein YyaL (SSP411 family)